MKCWIEYGGTFYNLSVLLRIRPLTDGGYVLEHQNETVNIVNSEANASVIDQIVNYLNMYRI